MGNAEYRPLSGAGKGGFYTQTQPEADMKEELLNDLKHLLRRWSTETDAPYPHCGRPLDKMRIDTVERCSNELRKIVDKYK